MMRGAYLIIILLLVGCAEDSQVASLREGLARVDSVGVEIAGLPADSIERIRTRLNDAISEVQWLGADSNVTFIREDSYVINELSKARRWLKDAPARIGGMNGEVERCRTQIGGLIAVIESGATIDAKGDTIDADYISENVRLELEAVESLKGYLEESQNYIRLGLETDRDNWVAIDSLLTAKKAMWARGVAGAEGEDLNSDEK